MRLVRNTSLVALRFVGLGTVSYRVSHDIAGARLGLPGVAMAVRADALRAGGTSEP